MADGVKFFVVCHVPVTGEQYVRDFNDLAALEAFLVEGNEDVGRIIEGVERSEDDFVGGSRG